MLFSSMRTVTELPGCLFSLASENLKPSVEKINLLDEPDDQVLRVLDEVIHMKSSSNEECRSSIVKLGETYVFPISSTSNSIADSSRVSTEMILQGNRNSGSSTGSSYEVVDASTQVSRSSSTSESAVESAHPNESGDTKSWWENAAQKKQPNEEREERKKAALNQSPNDMIEILRRSVIEGNVKAQESVKEFYQPTPEEINNIRKGSMYFARVSCCRCRSRLQVV